MIAMSTIWDETRRTLARRAGPIVGIAALAMLLPSALSSLVELWKAEQPAGSAAAAIATLAGIVTTLVMVWGQLGLTVLALDETTSAGRALRTALARLPALLLVILVLFVAVAALTVPLVVILAAAGVDMAAMAAGTAPTVPPAAALGIVAYALVILPVVVFALARLLLVSPVVVAERRHLPALARSWRLTRGLTFKLIGVLVLYAVVALLLLAAVRLVAGSLLLLVLGDDTPLNPATAILAVLVAAVAVALSVLSTLFVARLYRAIVAGESDGVAPIAPR